MNQFYISLVFTGIVLVFIAFIGILHDRKKSMDYISTVEEKKRELEEAMSDAEILIQEMNRCSEYLVTLVENKYREIDSASVSIDEKEDEMSKEHALEKMMGKNTRTFAYKVANTYENEAKKISDPFVLHPGEESEDADNSIIKENMMNRDATSDNKDRRIMEEVANGKNNPAAEENISMYRMPAMNKELHREVISLSKEGLGTTEIAKKLGVGRGEIELILDINK